MSIYVIFRIRISEWLIHFNIQSYRFNNTSYRLVTIGYGVTAAA